MQTRIPKPTTPKPTGVVAQVVRWCAYDGALIHVGWEKLLGLASVVGLLTRSEIVKVKLDPRRLGDVPTCVAGATSNRGWALKPITVLNGDHFFLGSKKAQDLMEHLFGAQKSAHFRSLMTARVFEHRILRVRVDPKLSGVEVMLTSQRSLHGCQFRAATSSGAGFFAKGMLQFSASIPGDVDALVSPDCVKSLNKTFTGLIHVGTISRRTVSRKSFLTPIGGMILALAGRIPAAKVALHVLMDYAVSAFKQHAEDVGRSLRLAVTDGGWMNGLAPRVQKRLALGARAWSLGWNPEVAGMVWPFSVNVIEKTLAGQRRRIVRSLGVAGVSIKRLPLVLDGFVADLFKKTIVTDAVPSGSGIAWRSPVLGPGEISVVHVLSTHEAISLGLLNEADLAGLHGDKLLWATPDVAQADKGDFDGDSQTVLTEGMLPKGVFDALATVLTKVQEFWGEDSGTPMIEVSDSSKGLEIQELIVAAIVGQYGSLQGLTTNALKATVEQLFESRTKSEVKALKGAAQSLGATVDQVTKLHKKRIVDGGAFKEMVVVIRRQVKQLTEMSKGLATSAYVAGCTCDEPERNAVGVVAHKCNAIYKEHCEKLRNVPLCAAHANEWVSGISQVWERNFGKPFPVAAIPFWGSLRDERVPEAIREAYELWSDNLTGVPALSRRRKAGLIDLDEFLEAMECLGEEVAQIMEPWWETLSPGDVVKYSHAMMFEQLNREFPNNGSFLLHSGAFHQHLRALEYGCALSGKGEAE